MSKKRREEIIKKAKRKLALSIVSFTLLLALVITAGVFMFTDRCDDCSAIIFGSGYYKEKESQGVLGSVFGSIFGDTEGIPLETVEDVTICRDCAMNNVSVKSELRGVEEFKQ